MLVNDGQYDAERRANRVNELMIGLSMSNCHSIVRLMMVDHWLFDWSIQKNTVWDKATFQVFFSRSSVMASQVARGTNNHEVGITLLTSAVARS